MLLKLLACNVFMREACLCIARSPHVIDVDFFELGEHAQPQRLNAALQARIDQLEQSPKRYDAILLLYGLCGNAAIGLQARSTRLVLPRAHDCGTILLGSKERFQEHFQDHPSTPFSCIGFLERGSYYLRTEGGQHQIHYGDQYAALVAQYGEDNARYIWDSMYPENPDPLTSRAVFIEVAETGGLGAAERFRTQAEDHGKTCVQLDGSLRLIECLLNGDWDPADFLIVEPNHQTAGVYDWSEIVRAVPGP
jgi:hypothetical protein